jgi:cytoskeleton protein RodZ
VGAVICAVLIVLWTVWPARKESVAAAPTVVAPDPVVPRPLPAVTPTEATPEPADASKTPEPVTVSANTAVVATASAPKPLPAHSTDAQGVRRITADGDDRLTFSFTQDCWVEIKDAQGGSLFSDLSKSGDTLDLVGHPPFHILLGNAPAVTLAFNGERVALSPHTRNNVGTLVLGQ